MVHGSIRHILVAEQDVATVQIECPELLARQVGQRDPTVGDECAPGRQDRPLAGRAPGEPDAKRPQELEVQDRRPPHAGHLGERRAPGRSDVPDPAEPLDQGRRHGVDDVAREGACEPESEQGLVIEGRQVGGTGVRQANDGAGGRGAWKRSHGDLPVCAPHRSARSRPRFSLCRPSFAPVRSVAPVPQTIAGRLSARSGSQPARRYPGLWDWRASLSGAAAHHPGPFVSPGLSPSDHDGRLGP